MGNYQIREVADGLGFIEGPIACRDGSVLVADLEHGTILRIDPETRSTSTFAAPGGGPNGLAIGPGGVVYVCNNGGRAFTVGADGYKVPASDERPPLSRVTPGIQRVDQDGNVETLYVECDGHALHHPNDLVFDNNGGFYFTDTGHPVGRLCDLGGLYYAEADGSTVVELVHDPRPHFPLTRPNGVGLSPDQKTLYVSETSSCRVWSWTVDDAGVIAPPDTNGNVYGGAALLFGFGGYTLFDSLAVDSRGNVCVATLYKGGVSVISPRGELVDFVELPEYDPFVTNVCFGGDDYRKAYVTSAGLGKVWEIEWPHPGLPLPHSI